MPVSHPLFKSFTGFLTVVFVWTSCIIPQNAQAQTVSAPGVARPLGQTFTPALIKGLRIDAQNAFQFEFLIDAGDAVGAGSKPALTQGRVTNPPLHDESLKLIKYFLASLTLPEKDLWVNLSPYEHDRIIPDAFGQTEMGRDLLEQDYILKQLTASLMSPENEEGKKFWEKVYERVYNNVGAYCNTPLQNNDGQCMQDAIESFNKVWIVPETGYFYEHNNTVFIADAKLKVMLEEDYLGNGGRGMVDKNKPSTNHQSPTTDIKSLIRQTILPLIEDEINNGASFANLRQIYNAQLLAVWFKKRLKDHILGQVYADKKNIESLSLRDEAEAIADIESIWQKYVAAFQSGASNIIQDEYDPVTQTIVPRKYFTGGATPVKKVDFASLNQAEAIAAGFTELAFVTVSIGDPAMLENNRKGVVDFILKQIDYGIDKSDLNLLSEEALNYAADEMKRGNVPLAVRYLEDAARRKETQLKNGANSFENGINPYAVQAGKRLGFGPQDFMWLEQNYPIGVFEDIIYEGGDPAGDDLAMLTPEEGEDLAMMSAFSAWVTFELNKSLEESERLDNNFWLRERYFELKQMAYKRYLQAMYREEYLDDVSDSIDDLEYWVGNQWDIFSEKFKNENKDLRSDLAMMIERKGGIDLRADQADIQIFESENGFKFPKIDPAMLKGMDLNFAPVIIRIKPVSVSQARMLLGLNAEDTKDSRDAAQPRDKAREIEVSAL